jgi:lipoprotein-anchoring transpeptidase ErfK/SrfK
VTIFLRHRVSLRRTACAVLVASGLVLALLGPVANAGVGAGPKPAHAAPKAKAKAKAKTAHVAKPKAKPTYPRKVGLSDDRTARWAAVMKPALVYAEPRVTSRAVTRLETRTSDETQNLVLVLGAIELDRKTTWYRVRLPILPNNSTGWVKRSALGDLYTVRTHLYVNLKTLTATLKRNGKPIFTTHVGLGRSAYPTPRGQFYIRDKLTNFDEPVYGPVAFGTSARSAVLTDWPGGGFVGVHGTNDPGILPGYVSHGCIRMPNEAILTLSRLMPVGTPLTIS